MSLVVFSGQCPECLLMGKSINMIKNMFPFWECPECHLQISIEEGNAIILRNRGTGDFKYDLSTFKNDFFLEKSDSNSHRNGKIIIDAEQLKKFIKTKVQPCEKFSHGKLIDSYVSYKYGNLSKEDYIVQSNHYNIDFDDTSIEDVLLGRDKQRNHSNLYAHFRLYRFLKIILDEFYKNCSFLFPVMGMSKIEHYLCIKHFPNDEKQKINSSPIFVKQAFRELAEDLIRIIYLDEKTLLSYDTEEIKKIENEIYNS